MQSSFIVIRGAGGRDAAVLIHQACGTPRRRASAHTEVAAVAMLVRAPSATSPPSVSVDPPLTYLSRRRSLSLSSLLPRWCGAPAVIGRLQLTRWRGAAAVIGGLTFPLGSTALPILPLPHAT